MIQGYISPSPVPAVGGGAVASGSLAAGSVVSGIAASGAVTGQAGGGFFVIASGTIAAMDIGSGAIISGRIASGVVGQGHLASGSVQGLGTLFTVASGTFTGFELGSGSIVSGRMASGQIGFGHLANASVQSGTIASGIISRFHMASGCVVDFLPSIQDISGVVAVAWNSGGCCVVPAERRSGLRMPAIGIVAGNFLSGDIVPVVRRGLIGYTASGVVASGGYGYPLYLGSGGRIVNLSGFMGGASSGTGPNPTLNTGEISGSQVQRLGMPVSGGIDVQIAAEVSSGLLSGVLGQR